jgi:hypothetical protein
MPRTMSLKEGFESFKSRYLSIEGDWGPTILLGGVQNAILKVLDRLGVQIGLHLEL